MQIAAYNVPRVVGATYRPASPCAAVLQSNVPTGAAVVTQGFSGFGYARYSQVASASPLSLTVNVKTLVTMTLDPTLTISALKSSFAGVVFYDGTTLLTPHTNDVLQARVAFMVTTIVAGGALSIDADLVASGLTLDTKSIALPNQAGVSTRVTFEMLLFSGAFFVSSGVRFYLTSSVPLTISSQTVVIAPQSAGP